MEYKNCLVIIYDIVAMGKEAGCGCGYIYGGVVLVVATRCQCMCVVPANYHTAAVSYRKPGGLLIDAHWIYPYHQHTHNIPTRSLQRLYKPKKKKRNIIHWLLWMEIKWFSDKIVYLMSHPGRPYQTIIINNNW